MNRGPQTNVEGTAPQGLTGGGKDRMETRICLNLMMDRHQKEDERGESGWLSQGGLKRRGQEQVGGGNYSWLPRR